MVIKQVKALINDGGFGKIEEVLCDDGNYYARKTFCPSSQFISNPVLCETLRQRFIREVKTQKKLPEELFIPIIFDDLTSSSPWFLMPIAADVYSNEILTCKHERRRPEGLGDILNSLEYIHNRGLIHRDLKPQNILFHNGRWKLADFGLISQDKEILSQTITTSNNALGTVMYAAPEQIKDFKRVTPLADIYSFGAILHDIFTDGSRVPYSELSGDGEIGAIIERCTKNNTAHRFKNVDTLRKRVLYFLSKDSIKIDEAGDEKWVQLIKKFDTWDSDLFENFVFYLKRNPRSRDILFEMESEILDLFYQLDKDLSNELSIIYSEWVYSRNFNFDYCDVIIGLIFKIYEKTSDLEVKSKAVIAAAELGRSHNRWYVMGYVVKMAGKGIDEHLAFRISLELELEDQNIQNFKRCAQGINLSISDYHPIIKETLE
jgi:serine/threonine protein kinase